MLLNQGIVYIVTVFVQNVTPSPPFSLRVSSKSYVPLISQSTLFHVAFSVACLSHIFPGFLRELGHQFHIMSIAF